MFQYGCQVHILLAPLKIIIYFDFLLHDSVILDRPSSVPRQIQLLIRLDELFIKMFGYLYSHFYQMNWSIISSFEQTLFCLEKFRLLLQVSILFVCNYHPLKWQYLIVGSFFLWMTIFAILETITRILYVINSKICCFNAALFSIAFCNRYQV